MGRGQLQSIKLITSDQLKINPIKPAGKLYSLTGFLITSWNARARPL
jgi:hypothetical protein